MEINIFTESPLYVPALCLLVGTPGPVLSLRKCTSGEGDDHVISGESVFAREVCGARIISSRGMDTCFLKPEAVVF